MFQDQAVNVTPMTVAIELPSFCTDLVDAGTYIVGVLSEAAFGPFDPSLPFSTYGKVGPDLQPLGFSNNRLEQVGYGQYRLRIHHVSYYAGTISNGEVRGGCLAYGQWRTYHIDTVGENASVLEISLTSPISAIYARAGRGGRTGDGDELRAVRRTIAGGRNGCDGEPVRRNRAYALARCAAAREQGDCCCEIRPPAVGVRDGGAFEAGATQAWHVRAAARPRRSRLRLLRRDAILPTLRRRGARNSHCVRQRYLRPTARGAGQMGELPTLGRGRRQAPRRVPRLLRDGVDDDAWRVLRPVLFNWACAARCASRQWRQAGPETRRRLVPWCPGDARRGSRILHHCKYRRAVVCASCPALRQDYLRVLARLSKAELAANGPSCTAAVARRARLRARARAGDGSGALSAASTSAQ